MSRVGGGVRRRHDDDGGFWLVVLDDEPVRTTGVRLRYVPCVRCGGVLEEGGDTVCVCVEMYYVMMMMIMVGVVGATATAIRTWYLVPYFVLSIGCSICIICWGCRVLCRDPPHRSRT